MIFYLVVADAVWSDWGNWDGCSVTCGTGIQERTRVCSTAYNGGTDTCIGTPNTMSQECSSQLCPGISENSNNYTQRNLRLLIFTSQTRAQVKT